MESNAYGLPGVTVLLARARLAELYPVRSIQGEEI